MKLPRRRFLHLAAGTAVLPAVSRITRAQTYPSRPVRLIVGFFAGGVADILARQFGQWLSERFGQQFIVENQPGAGTNIATDAVVRAPADGYTLLLITSANAINSTLYDNLNFIFIRDIVPIASIARTSLVMEVNPSVPAKTVPEFIAYAEATPGRITMASAGNGSAMHVAGELFEMMTGVNLVHVPYRGSYLPDLIGGQVQVAFSPLPTSIELIRADKLRALAITSATRSVMMPEIPTVAEFVPGYEASAFFGVGAPKNTSTEIVDQLNREINAGLDDPTIEARLADMGAVAMPMTPAEFGKFIAADTEKWSRVIKFAGITPD